MALFDPTQTAKLHMRNTDFFGSKLKFKQFKDDV